MKLGLAMVAVAQILLYVLFFFSVSNAYMKASDAFCLEQNTICVDDKKQNPQWVTVFVHGTYGSSLGLMSLAQVWRDRPEGTWYHKIQQAMRKNGQFYRNRLMSREGLVRIAVGGRQEEYDDPLTKGLISIYDNVAKQLDPTSSDIFYTYGWNGLLSQTERRKEAIKLYNELSAEVERCCEGGVRPRVRIISHSHGGNVALNLAAIYELINGIENKAATCESRGCMQKLLNTLPSSGDISPWFFRPKASTFTVDELVMYATPIQQETEPFCFSPFFKQVYNVYSENDVVQVADFISTQSRKSRRCIQVENYKHVSSDHIKQVRITVERSMKSFHDKDEVHGKINVDFKAPLRGGKLVSRAPKDPAHADFWCITWNKRDTFYDPLPIVVFTPYVLSLMQKTSGYQHSTINITKTKNNNSWAAQFSLVDCAKNVVLSSRIASMKFIKNLRRQLWLARPASFTYTFSFGSKPPHEE